MIAATIRDAVDLALARECLRCGRTGRVLCSVCELALASGIIVTTLDGVPVASCGEYRGALRDAILDYKVRGTRALTQSLSRLLGASVIQANDVSAAHVMSESTLVVPVPGHARPARGFAALDALTRPLTQSLPAHLTLAPVLALTHGYRPVKGQSRSARAESVRGSMRCTPSDTTARRAILIDDVLTTGATVREGMRALSTYGIETVAVAVLASPGMSATRHAPARATLPH